MQYKIKKLGNDIIYILFYHELCYDGKEYFFVMSNGKILDTLEDREWKKEE